MVFFDCVAHFGWALWPRKVSPEVREALNHRFIDLDPETVQLLQAVERKEQSENPRNADGIELLS